MSGVVIIGGLLLLVILISVHKQVYDNGKKLDAVDKKIDGLLHQEDFSEEDKSVLAVTDQVHDAQDRIPNP